MTQLRHRRPSPAAGGITSERNRAWAYRIILALGTLALLYGWTTSTELAAWLGLAGALLGNGLAAGHTSTRRETARRP